MSHPAAPRPLPPRNDLPERAREIARDVLARHAADVDRDARFPAESVEALRDAGLLAYFVPPELGGTGGNLETYARIAEALGGECLSTAMIWVMHAHQTAVLAEHRSPEHEPFLREIAARGTLLASVTSETGKGGDVLRADAPLVREGSRLRVVRSSPFVSYGERAGLFLVTMRAGADRPPADVRLVLVRPDDGRVRVAGTWDAMGLRGTCSVPLEMDVTVGEERVVGRSFRDVALRTLVPAAQVGWTAAWYGAAKGAMTRFLRERRERHAPRASSDLSLARIAELRLELDLVESILLRVARRMDRLREQDAPAATYEDLAHNVLVNNLKIAGSRSAFAVVDGLIALSGLGPGYLRGEGRDLERVFRDLRSAALMFSNDRLLLANGRLLLVEGLPVHRIWAGGEA